MNGFAVFLVIASTFFHAGWNLLARRVRSEQTFFLRALLALSALGLAPFLATAPFVAPWPATVWLCVAATGLFCGGYFFALSKAYGMGDFTVVYPVARALPVLMVGLGDALRGRPPTTAGWIGMSLVALACMAVPLPSLRKIRLSHYVNRTMLWALLAALCTTGYSLTDKFALETVSAGPLSAARYGYAFYLSSTVVLVALVRLFGGPRGKPEAMGWKTPIAAGLMTYGAYWMILWAYQIVPHAAYVVAFRQFSILIGVIVGVACFRERGGRLRIAATCLLVLGLVLIGVYGKGP